MVRGLAITLLLLSVGCITSLDILRGHDAHVREENAREIIKEVEALRSLQEPCSTDAEQPTESEQILALIEDMAEDEIQRAEVAQVDHEWKPKKTIDPKSDKTDDKFNEYAGRVHAREAKRRRRRSLPGRIVSGIFGLLIGLIPQPIRTAIRWIFYIALIVVAGPVLLWVYRKYRIFRKAAFEAIQGAEKLPPEQRKEAFGDKETLQKVRKQNGIK